MLRPTHCRGTVRRAQIAITGAASCLPGKDTGQMPRMLTHEQARAFYNRFGKKQDRQGFYEDRAIGALIAHGNFREATAVFEFGCGTGRFAETLLKDHLLPGAAYTGVDISQTMVSLAKARLAPFGPRADVRLTDGSLRFDFRPSSFDRFVSNYVLDLLAFDDIAEVLREAERLLLGGGMLGLVSLTHGFTPLSRIVVSLWRRIHALRPSLVGGCRPVSLTEFVTGPVWQVLFHDRFSSFGMPSEVLVAEKVKA